MSGPAAYSGARSRLLQVAADDRPATDIDQIPVVHVRGVIEVAAIDHLEFGGVPPRPARCAARARSSPPGRSAGARAPDCGAAASQRSGTNGSRTYGAARPRRRAELHPDEHIALAVAARPDLEVLGQRDGRPRGRQRRRWPGPTRPWCTIPRPPLLISGARVVNDSLELATIGGWRVTDARTGIARRTLLGGGLAALAGAAGCQRLAADPLPAAPGLSARTLTATPPFFVGWRGGSRDWPEMTTYGFEQAAAIPGILAMELVVAQTADSVLVCSADPTTQRVTGLDFTVAEETWATLSGLKVRATETKDPRQPSQTAGSTGGHHRPVHRPFRVLRRAAGRNGRRQPDGQADLPRRPGPDRLEAGDQLRPVRRGQTARLLHLRLRLGRAGPYRRATSNGWPSPTTST